jgi:hypothetical protein
VGDRAAPGHRRRLGPVAGGYAPAYLVLHGPAGLLALPAGTLAQQIIIHGVLSGIVAVFAFGRAVELLGPPRAAAFPPRRCPVTA